jgi:hypothetical protein
LKGRDDDHGAQDTCKTALTNNRATYVPSSNDAALELESSPSPFGNCFKLINL